MKNLREHVGFGALLILLAGVPAISAPSGQKLTLEQATTIATQKVTGVVKSSEFEHEIGQDVYSFDIIGNDKKIHEVLVNAYTGKIVSNKIESAAKEAKEAAEEKK